jgi:hypothetical protein
MNAPITPLEALEGLVGRLAGSGFTDDAGRPLERTEAFRAALAVLDDQMPLDQPRVTQRSH